MTCCASSSQLIIDSKHTEWIKNLPDILHNEPISKIAIPVNEGTHDSFSFHLTRHAGPDLDPNLRRFHTLISPIIKKWSKTQKLTFTQQLHIGIRYFDLRICRTKDLTFAKQNPFTFTHGLMGSFVRTGLQEMNEYLNKYEKEIILLDFNHFYDFNEECGHEQLIELIFEVFGNKICTSAETLMECTLNYLWNNQQQVIILYDYDRNQSSTYTNRIGHFFQMCQSPWPNTSRIDNLFAFLDEKVSTYRITDCINVVQGQITPDGATIQNNPFSSLEKYSIDTNRRLIQWILLRHRDPSLANGVNVIICDFADEQFTDAVIKLNYKRLIDTTITSF